MATILDTHGHVIAEETLSDDAAVRKQFGELIAAWGRGDGHAYGGLFSDDADYIAFDGSRTTGRRTIAESHQKLFDTWLKGTRLVGRIEDIRFPSPDIALVVATGATVMPGKDRPQRPSIQTLVAKKHDGAWRFIAFQNTRIVKRNALQWMLYGIGSKLFRRG